MTSSNPVAGTVCAGSGPGPKKNTHRGRSGQGLHHPGWEQAPSPTELKDANGKHLRAQGQEFGSTTGRPRRCGWLDAVVLNDSVRLSGVEQLAITKLDVLTGLPTLNICTGYKIGRKSINNRSRRPGFHTTNVSRSMKPLPGWTQDITSAKSMSDLPKAARTYLERIAKLTGVNLGIVSVGPGREQTISLMDPF